MLEVESGGCIFRCRKNQTNERKTSTLYSLLKTVLPWRSTDAITGHQQRADAGDIAHRHRRSTCRTALPCSTILSPRSKAHQREICAGYCCCSPALYVRPRELLEQSQLFAGRRRSCFCGFFLSSSAVGLPAKCFLNTCRELHFRNMDTVLRDQKQRGGRRSGAGRPVKSSRTNRTPRGKENVQSHGAVTSPKAVA